MAKRYIRINWQNRPNVATPLSAANLNKMDKGIDDIDNAIEEIYNKRVNNVVTTNPDTFLAGPVGKTLQDQITTLNNNLATQTINILPLITGVNNDYTIDYATAVKYGKTISLAIMLAKNGSFQSAETTALILPSGYRPAVQIRQPCMLHNGSTVQWGYDAMGFCYVDTAGSLIVRDYTTSGKSKAIIKLDYIVS